MLFLKGTFSPHIHISDQKYAVSVGMLDTRCYCEFVTNVAYDNFQDILSWELHMQGIQEIPKEHLHTFQLLIHATKTTNLWSQQHSPSWNVYTELSQSPMSHLV